MNARVVLGLLLALPPLGLLGYLAFGGGRGDPPCWEEAAAAPARALAALRVAEDVVVFTLHGVEQRVPRRPARIASVLPGLTEALAWMGAGRRLVAVSPWCDPPPEAPAPRRVGVQPLDVEGLLAARADLVVADRRLLRRDLGRLGARLPAVLLLETSRSLADLRDALEVLAAVLDTDAARAALAAFDAEWARLGPWAGHPPLRALIVGDWDPLYALGPGSLLDDLAREAGLANVACDLPAGASGPFSEELVLARAPEVILSTVGPPPERIRARWARVPALSAGRWFDLSDDRFLRGGPRILGALAELRAVVAAWARGAAPGGGAR